MITLDTLIQGQDDLTISVNAPKKKTELVYAGDKRQINEASLDVISLINKLSNNEYFNMKNELSEEIAYREIKRLTEATKYIFKDETVSQLEEIIECEEEFEISILTDPQKIWIPWELLIRRDRSLTEISKNIWGCKYKIYRRFPINQTFESDNDPTIILKDKMPRIMVSPPYYMINNAKDREIPYFRYLQAERIANVDFIRDDLDPKNWTQDFKFLCSKFEEDTSELFHFIGFYTSSESKDTQYNIMVGNEFRIPIENLKKVNKDSLLFLSMRCGSNGPRKPEDFLIYISKLLDVGAKGVVGSAYPIPDNFSAVFAEKFYKRFLLGWEIGDTILSLKQLFLSEFNNPLALFYTIFTNLKNPNVRLSIPDFACSLKSPKIESLSKTYGDGSFNNPNKYTATILHLSDLHYGCDHRSYSDETRIKEDLRGLDELIKKDLDEMGIVVDGIVISGDLSCKGIPDEFNWALSEIQKLSEALRINSENISIIPGNHDVNWISEDQKILPANDAKSSYRTFYQLFFNKRPMDNDKLYHLAFLKEKNLLILGLDSCMIESESTAGIGYIGDKQFTEAIQKIRSEYDNKNPFKIAVLHHHLLPVERISSIPSENENFSLVMDASGVLRNLYKENFAIILHGHQHQPYYSDLYLPDIRRNNVNREARLSRMAIIGAGSMGINKNKLGNIRRYHYNIITINANSKNASIKIHGRATTMHSDEEFEQSHDITFELGKGLGMIKNS